MQPPSRVQGSIRLAHAHHRPSLGDMLQRLAVLSPADLHHLTRLVADVLREAERDHARRFPHQPLVK